MSFETGSFTKAARRNGCTPSHACHAFRSVEEHFGVRCAVRDRQHFRVTSEGWLCYQHCLEMLPLQRQALRQVERTRKSSAAILILAVLSQLRPPSTPAHSPAVPAGVPARSNPCPLRAH